MLSAALVQVYLCFALAGVSPAAAPHANLLIIIADDFMYCELPVYGGRNARTPNIDRLAAEGLTFNRAYLAEAMCQPC